MLSFYRLSYTFLDGPFFLPVAVSRRRNKLLIRKTDWLKGQTSRGYLCRSQRNGNLFLGPPVTLSRPIWGRPPSLLGRRRCQPFYRSVIGFAEAHLAISLSPHIRGNHHDNYRAIIGNARHWILPCAG